MLYVNLIKVGQLRASPDNQELLREVIVQNDAGEQSVITIIGYRARDFNYQLGTILLVHTCDARHDIKGAVCRECVAIGQCKI